MPWAISCSWVNIIAVPILIVLTVFWCILLYRHWSLLQGHGARTTPGKAVGYGFIPVFFFYWWFVAYAGLATDNNRYLRQLGITTKRMSFGLAVTDCILSILFCTVGLYPPVSAVLTVPYMIIGFILVLQQRDCVLAILHQRAQGRGDDVPASEPEPVSPDATWASEAETSARFAASQATPQTGVEDRAVVGPPRLSRAAIWGVMWAPLFLMRRRCSLWSIGSRYRPAVCRPARPGGQSCWASHWLPLGLTSPFGTTILGGIAISQIKHSQGRLYGLGLAVFDALLFPLLALNGGLIAGWSWLADQVAPEWIPQMGRAWFSILVVGLVVMSCVVVSWLIIRAVWRGANRAPGNDQASRRRPASSGGSQFFTGPAWYVGILVGLALVAGLIAWGMWERRSTVSPETVVRVEAKLRQQIDNRLSEAGWRMEGLSVSVSPDLKRAECRFGTAWQGNMRSIPFVASIRITLQGKNLWLVAGDGEFRFLRFSVDTSAEMLAGQGKRTARVNSYDGKNAFAVQQKLLREVADRLKAANYRWDQLTMAIHYFVNPDLAECMIEGLRKPADVALQEGSTVQLFDALSGGLDIRHAGRGLWIVRGTGDLTNVNFSVDTAAEMGPPEKFVTMLPKPFQYSEPEEPDTATSLVQDRSKSQPPARGRVRPLARPCRLGPYPRRTALARSRCSMTSKTSATSSRRRLRPGICRRPRPAPAAC